MISYILEVHVSCKFRGQFRDRYMSLHEKGLALACSWHASFDGSL